ncbi:hypothetical protein PDJAM_G00175520 [Pangasius djambal]|uniref:Uncharacterized protein n=1 Tax=Pangasius djambal TaxID=1691987 RepID=A0ACC5ZPC5_9TELE|nr:hypothetical protein [Pangasius djambal]
MRNFLLGSSVFTPRMRTSVPGFAVTKMADVSLDELIRRRNFNTRGGLKRPTFGRGAGLTGRGAGSAGRGAGLMGRTFDARQKIGSTDVRQRLGGSGAFQVKDAREKLGQNDARFRIQARGGAASAVQDARQTINSRKQQQVQDSPLVTTSQTPIPHIHIQNSSNPSSTGVRAFPTSQGLGARVGVAIQPRGGITKVVDARDRLSLKRSVSSLPSQGSAAPLKITKTIQTPENTSSQPAQPVFSPLEGTKITVNNLHPRVTEEDIVELFCVCGALKRARLVKVGVAEVVFVRKDDAISAYRKYNNRCLDGQPMKCNLHIQGSVITSDQPILLRLSDSPGKKETPSSAVSRSTPRSSSAEVDPQTILKALFKSSNQSSASTETPPPAAHSTAFRIKI